MRLTGGMRGAEPGLLKQAMVFAVDKASVGKKVFSLEKLHVHGVRTSRSTSSARQTNWKSCTATSSRQAARRVATSGRTRLDGG
jgi:hypothetical protein